MESGTNKQRILECAYQLGGLYGLESLTIGQLAGQLGMSKAGVYGHFGSKQALQLETIRYARTVFLRDVVQPAEEEPAGVPRLWAMCNTLVSYSTDTGLHGGDFWVTVFHEYGSRSGPVRDAVERTFGSWVRRLEELIATAVELRQLEPCDPAQVAFETQALLNAGSHVFRLCHDPKAPGRARAAIRQRLETLRGQAFPVLED
ncbi:MAG TPA: TetR/AcrR family transcriptional regulator [Streptosporangiaceae bacterium]